MQCPLVVTADGLVLFCVSGRRGGEVHAVPWHNDRFSQAAEMMERIEVLGCVLLETVSGMLC